MSGPKTQDPSGSYRCYPAAWLGQGVPCMSRGVVQGKLEPLHISEKVYQGAGTWS